MPASGGPYLVMPITFKAGESNDFQLVIISDDKLALFEVEGNAQALKVSSRIPEPSHKANAKEPAGYAMIVSPGGTSKDIALPKEVSGSSHNNSKADSIPLKASSKAEPIPLKASSKVPKSSSQAQIPEAKTPKSPKQPKTSREPTKSTPLKGSTTNIDLSRDRRGDIILSFGSSKPKTKTKTTTVESFYCGGCGAIQKKGAKQCTSCGVKLKK